MRLTFQFLLVSICTTLLISSCEKPLPPIGYANPNVAIVEANGWKSVDTIISVNPQTFIQDTSLVMNDFKPDTLSDGRIVYQLTEYAPIFAGCETDEDPAICTQVKLREFVNDKLEYPRWALVRGIQGSSIATFVIGADGRVSTTGVEQSLGDEMDKAVLQLVEQIPVWYPAFHNGKPVAVRYRLPVTFTLPEE